MPQPGGRGAISASTGAGNVSSGRPQRRGQRIERLALIVDTDLVGVRLSPRIP